jgi:hypothetical protein
VLRGEPAAQHVVRARHDLDADALEVRVEVARGQVDRLAGLERDEVEEQRAHDADVAGVLAGDARGPLALAREGGGGPCRARDGDLPRERGAPVERRGHDALEERREAALDQHTVLDAQRVEEGDRRAWIPEPREGVELGERRDELGLVAVVTIRAVGCVERDAERVLPLVPAARLLDAGMGLQTERLDGGEHLQQEGSRSPKRRCVAAPSIASGAPATSSVRVFGSPSRTTRDGAAW